MGNNISSIKNSLLVFLKGVSSKSPYYDIKTIVLIKANKYDRTSKSLINDYIYTNNFYLFSSISNQYQNIRLLMQRSFVK